MKAYIRLVGISVSSLFFLLQTPALLAQETAATHSIATSAVSAEPQTAGQIVSSAEQVVPALPVPRVLKFSGVLKDLEGNPRHGVLGITFSIYADELGGMPLWMETQNLGLDTYGRYAALLGSTQSAGIPLDLFAAGEPRWLGVKVELPGEIEQTRVLLVSVPYALKASDADTLGGKPASAYLLAPEATSVTEPTGGTIAPTAATAKTTKPAITSSGTANYIPMFTDSSGDIGNSVIYQSSSGNIGIGYTSPNAKLLIGAPAGGGVLNATNLADQDMQITLTVPGATDKHAFFGTSTLTNLTLGVGGLEKMRITNAGNVGIGYSNPQQRLVIGAPAGGTVLNSTNLADQDLNVILSVPGATDKHTYFGPSVPTNLTLGVGGLEKMRITNSGNVGIGTTTPAATLDVNGSVNALSFTSSSGFGGSSPTSFGVYGDSINPAPGAAGVFGYILNTYSNQYLEEAGIAIGGLWGDAADGGNGIGIGIFGTADSDYAGAFVNSSTNFPALFADNNAGTGSTISGTIGLSASGSAGDGVDGISSSGGNGVYGIAYSLGDQQAGVLGVGNTTSSTYAAYNIYSGVWGDTGTSSTSVAPAWAIGVLGTADDSHAGVFLNDSSSWSTMYVSNASTGGTGLFKTLQASTPTGTCGFGGNGDLTCTGQMKTLATTSGGARKVETYAMQSPENWMEDFGSATLQSGVAVVNIDPTFAETVSETADYHIFITPNGDSKGLYVFRKTAASFEVRESGGGTSSLSFDYRIVAKRRGYETQRLNDVTDLFTAEQKPLEGAKAKATAVHSRPAPSPLLRKTYPVTKRPLPGSQSMATKNLAFATHP